MISIGISTRGVIYARTIESILEQKPDRIVFAKEMPVPDCYNWIIDNTEGDVLFVDDDMFLPKGTLDSLKRAKVDVALCDYSLDKGNSVQYHLGEFLFGGLGCVLVKREVLDNIRFRTDVGYIFPSMQKIKRNPQKHGGQDVDFFQQCKQKGYTIKVVGTVGHLRSDLPHLKGNNTSYKVREL